MRVKTILARILPNKGKLADAAIDEINPTNIK